MPLWLTIFLSCGGSTLIGLIINAIFASLVGKKRQLEEIRKTYAQDIEKMKTGIQALLRNDLYTLYDKCKSKGCATITEKIDFENMYQQYHNMHQNGVMENVYKNMMALPESDDEDDVITDLYGSDLNSSLVKKYMRNKEKK